MNEKTITDAYPSMVLAEKGKEKQVQPMPLGKRIKEIRTKNNLTLEEASKLTGLARSTLSKIENEQISPTFAVMQKLAAGLEIDIPQLFARPEARQASGRRDVTRAGEGKPHPTPTYEHELLSTQLTNKRMMPYRSKIHARSFEDFGDWVRHEGEEFMYVLEGQVKLITEFYEPVFLDAGDSVYYDATMGHMALTASEEEAVILWVTAS